MHKMQVCILTGKSLWVNLPFFKRGSFSYFAYFAVSLNRAGGSGADPPRGRVRPLPPTAQEGAVSGNANDMLRTTSPNRTGGSAALAIPKLQIRHLQPYQRRW